MPVLSREPVPVNMVTVRTLLTLFFVSDVLASCLNPAVLVITTPETMEALSGSCLQIPCSFTAKEEGKFNGSRASFGAWIKNDPKFAKNINNVIFNSSRTVQTYPMRITGSLTQKNCTTLFSDLTAEYSNTYYFRVNNWPFQATASCSPLRISVKDSARKPGINISGELKEKESVTITCSAFTPCPHSPPELTWNLQQNSHRQMEENTDGTFTAKIQETITLSDTHDGYTISCSVRYPVNEGKHVKTAETEVTLSVSYAPKDTSASISPSGLVSAGSWMNLSCSSRANPPISSFTWFKNSKHGAMKVAEGDFYRLKMTNMTDIESYFCVAANILGNETSSWTHLKNKGKLTELAAAVGVTIATILLICVIFLIWWLKSKHPTSHPSQSLVLQEPASTAENQDIHYGEIDFSVMRLSSDSAHEATQQQNAVYSQVNVHKTEESFTLTGGDIYASVKRK
ncbi:myelin-associated glycoprotein-like [Leuresthes tenuis]|uniref:myelin-associated glycoprotein-like n=1 Tax=Leuresthes tenuis TaxID=355514 RepID=UPI003B511BD8